MFEPLHPWATTGCANQTRNERLDFLVKLAKCEFEERYDASMSWKVYQKKFHVNNNDMLDQRGSDSIYFLYYLFTVKAVKHKIGF